MDQTYIARTDMENRWSLTSADHALVVAKSQDNRLSFAALLLFFRNHGHFPRTKTEIDHEVIENIALHLDVASPPEGLSISPIGPWSVIVRKSVPCSASASRPMRIARH